MPDYLYDHFQGGPFEIRFSQAGWIQGILPWETGIQLFPFGGYGEPAREWIREIRRFRPPLPELPCPRVFISHRQIDDAYARRIAQLAIHNQFNYWLDVIDLDPLRNSQVRALETKLQRPLTAFEKDILTAAVIEMALLNCTHVLAVMTQNTVGSQWVPYEYGRVKEPPPLSCEASCWWDYTSLPSANFPEYMFLGEILGIESEICLWFRSERAKYNNCDAAAQDFKNPDEGAHVANWLRRKREVRVAAHHFCSKTVTES